MAHFMKGQPLTRKKGYKVRKINEFDIAYRTTRIGEVYNAAANHPTTAMTGYGRGRTQDEAMHSARNDLLRKIRHDGPVELVKPSHTGVGSEIDPAGVSAREVLDESGINDRAEV